MASPFTNGHDRATAITPAISASGEAARRRMVLAHLPAVVFAAPDVEAGLRRVVEHVAGVLRWDPQPQHSVINVDFASETDAATARDQLHGWVFEEVCIQAFLSEDAPPPRRTTMDTLQVPRLTKQFLISPPSSPPIGWEPKAEDPPVVDLALVEALMGMEPGIPHELVPAAAGLPAIFVEDCTDGAPPMRSARPPLNGAPSWLAKLTVDEEESDGFKHLGVTNTRCPPRR